MSAESGDPSATSPRRPSLPSRQLRILVADDHDGVARLIETALRDDGYELLRARDGAEAVRLAEHETLDLILLDVAMPTIDGFAACRAIRATPRLARVPIIMLTAQAEAARIQTGFAEGATDYMLKPFSVAQLRTRVKTWLLRSTASSQ